MTAVPNKSSPAKKVVWLALALLLLAVGVVGVPNFIRTRSSSCCNACLNNLRQIDAAANQFALEQHKTNGEAIKFPDDLTPCIRLNRAGKIPPCTDGGVHSLKRVGDTPTCSLGTTVTPTHVLP